MREGESVAGQNETMESVERGVDVEKIVREGELELQQVKQELEDAYEARMTRGMEKPRAQRRLIIVECGQTGDTATRSITLADERIDPSNTDVCKIAQGENPPTDYDNVAGVIFSGSAANIDEKEEKPWIGQAEEYMKQLLDRGIPVFGICFGMQLYADLKGRAVPKNVIGEHKGPWKTSVFMSTQAANDPFFRGFELQTDADGQNSSMVLTTMGLHSYRAGYSAVNQDDILAYCYPPEQFDFNNVDPDHLENDMPVPNEQMQAQPMIEREKSFYGVQFHPELDNELKVRQNLAVRKSGAARKISAGEDPMPMIEASQSYLDEIKSGTQRHRSDLFLRNFLDICGVK